MAGAMYSLGVAEGIIRIDYDPKGVGLAIRDQEKLRVASGKTSSAMTKHSRIMAEAALVIVAALGLAAKKTVDFQSKMTLLVTAGGESQAALGSVATGIEKIATETGTSLDQLADGMYLVEKAGYRGAKGLVVLRAAAQGAKAEGTDLATMTQGLTSIMQSYAGTMKDPVQATNELVAAAGMAKTTMQAFVGSLPTVLPIASAAGISFAEVAGALATLTQHGTSADEATQELASTIRNLQAPNNVAVKAMQQLGINVTDLEKNLGKRGLAGTIELVTSAIGKHMGPSGLVAVDAFQKSQSAGEDLRVMLSKMPPDLKRLAQGFLDGSVSAKDYRTGIKDLGGQGYAMGTQFMALQNTAQGFNQLLKSGNPQAATFAAYLKQVMGGAIGMNTALQLSGESTTYLHEAIETVNKSALASGKDVSTWAKTQATAKVQLDKLKASGEVFAVTLGAKVLPVLLKLAEMLRGALNWFSGLSGGWQEIIAGALAFVAAMLLVGAAFKKVSEWAKALKELALLLKLNVIWTNLVSAATKIWAGVQAILDAEMWASPIGLIILAIVALVAAVILVIKYHKQIGRFFVFIWGKIWSFMKMVGAWFAGPFAGFFKRLWKDIEAPFLAIWAFLKSIGRWFAGPFADFFKKGWSYVVEAFNFVKRYVVGFIKFVFSILTGLWQFVVKIISPFVPLFKAVFGLIWAIIRFVFTLIWSFISLYLMLIWKAIKFAGNTIVAVWNAVWNFVKGVVEAVWNWINARIQAAVALTRAIIQAVSDWITNKWNQLWNWVKGIIEAVWGFIGPYVMGAVNGVKTALAAAWNAIKNTAITVWNKIKSVAKTVWNAIMSAVEVVAGLAKKIGGYFQKAYDAVKSKVETVISYVKGLGGKILGAIGDFGKLLYNQGKKIIQGLIDGITGMFNKLKDKLNKVTDLIPSWKGPMQVDAKLLTPNGKAIMGGLVKGISGATPELEKALRAVTNSIPYDVQANVHAQTFGAAASVQRRSADVARGSAQFGPYQMTVDGKVLATFVIDTVTGQPKTVANTTTEGTRQLAWAGSGR